MEKWNGVVLDINATCASLGQALYSQLLGAHTLSGCDTVLFSLLARARSLSAGNFPGLLDVLGEEGATQADLMETVLHNAIQTSCRHIFKNLPTASCSGSKMDLESISNIK